MAMQTCCFCFDLKHGTLAVGVFTVTIKLLGALTLAIALGVIHRKPDNSEFKDYADILFGISIGVSIISTIFGSLLIVGVRKSIRGLFIPWMVLAILEVASLGYGFFGSIVLVSEGYQMIIQAIAFLIGIALLIYMFWCVCSYYKDLSSQNVPPYQGFTDECNRNEVPKMETKYSNAI